MNDLLKILLAAFQIWLIFLFVEKGLYVLAIVVLVVMGAMLREYLI